MKEKKRKKNAFTFFIWGKLASRTMAEYRNCSDQLEPTQFQFRRLCACSPCKHYSSPNYFGIICELSSVVIRLHSVYMCAERNIHYIILSSYQEMKELEELQVLKINKFEISLHYQMKHDWLINIDVRTNTDNYRIQAKVQTFSLKVRSVISKLASGGILLSVLKFSLYQTSERLQYTYCTHYDGCYATFSSYTQNVSKQTRS